MLESPTVPVKAVKLIPTKLVAPEDVTLVLLTADNPLVMLLKVKPGWLPLCIVNECMYSSELPHWSSAVTLTTLVPLPSGHVPELLTVNVPFLFVSDKPPGVSVKLANLLQELPLVPTASISIATYLSLLFSETFHIIVGVVSDVFVPFRWARLLIVTAVIVGFVVSLIC